MQIRPHNYNFQNSFKLAYDGINELQPSTVMPMADQWREFKSTIKGKRTSKWIPFLRSLDHKELTQLQQELPNWPIPNMNKHKMQSALTKHVQQTQTTPQNETTNPTVTESPVTDATNVSQPSNPVVNETAETGPIELSPSNDRGQLLEQLHNSYRSIWNSFIKEVRPRLKDTVKVHNDIINLITNSNVNQVWMAMRQALQSQPEMLNAIPLSDIQNANQSISSAQQALNAISQSDQMLDNQLINFQQSLLSTINMIKQISFSNQFTQPNAYAASPYQSITAEISSAKKLIANY